MSVLSVGVVHNGINSPLSLIIQNTDYFKQHSDPKHDDTALLFIEKVDGPLYPVKRSGSVGAEYADFSD